MKINEYLEKQKEMYGNLYSLFEFTLDDIDDFQEDTTLKSRAYYKNVKILKDYNNLLDKISLEASKKKGILGFLSNNDRGFINSCEEFKGRYTNELNKLFFCSECKCLKCISECKFNPCICCNKTGKVSFCDKENVNLIIFKNFIKRQYNGETGNEDPVEIICEIRFSDDNLRYRIIRDVSTDEKLVLEYEYSMKEGDLYNSISDVDRFNEVIEVYEGNRY